MNESCPLTFPTRYDATIMMQHASLDDTTTAKPPVPGKALAAATSGSLFGVAIDKVTRIDDATGLPVVIPKCIQYIRDEGLEIRSITLLLLKQLLYYALLMSLLLSATTTAAMITTTDNYITINSTTTNCR